MSKKVVYLTGAPSTGKSTLTANLALALPDIIIFAYSAKLLDWMNKKIPTLTSREDLRKSSAQLVTREDINKVDQLLLDLVATERETTNIVIDSHPVTIEKFGFRITPFSKAQINQLKPDVIVCLYAAPEIIHERISKDNAGRMIPTLEELGVHMSLQAQVANLYAFETGASLYFLDTNSQPSELLDRFLRVTKLT